MHMAKHARSSAVSTARERGAGGAGGAIGDRVAIGAGGFEDLGALVDLGLVGVERAAVGVEVFDDLIELRAFEIDRLHREVLGRTLVLLVAGLVVLLLVLLR